MPITNDDPLFASRNPNIKVTVTSKGNLYLDELTGTSSLVCNQAEGYDMNKHTSEKSYAQGKETNTAKFDAQIQTVTQERGKDYGRPEINFIRMASADEIIKDCADKAIQHAMRMILYKICRLVESPMHLDSVVDIAGYARCIAMIQDARLISDTIKEDRDILKTC